MNDAKNNEMSDHINKVVDSIHKSQEQAADAAEHTQDVKDGKCTADDEKHEPGYVLYKGITDTVVSIYQDPKFINILQELCDSDNKDPKPFVDLLTMTVTQAAYMSIVFYDELLKKELTKQFDGMVDFMNKLNQDNQAFHSVLKVFRKKVDDLLDAKKISDFNKSSHLQ